MTTTDQSPAEDQTKRLHVGSVTILAVSFGLLGAASLLSYYGGPSTSCNLSSANVNEVRLGDRLSTVQEKLGCGGEETSRWGSSGNTAFTQAFRNGSRVVDVIFNHGRAAAINRF